MQVTDPHVLIARRVSEGSFLSCTRRFAVRQAHPSRMTGRPIIHGTSPLKKKTRSRRFAVRLAHLSRMTGRPIIHATSPKTREEKTKTLCDTDLRSR